MSHLLHYEGRQVETQGHETVLDALLRVGIEVPFSCKGGSCHTCLMQCTEGEIPSRAQRGLSEPLTQLHYFLPCRCHAIGDMALRPPQPDDLVTRCMLCEVSGHDSGTVQLLFEAMSPLRYRTGQRLRIVLPDAPLPEPVLEIVLDSDPAVDMVLRGTLRLGQGDGAALPDWLGPDAEFGLEFDVRGPFDDRPARELPMPTPDPALWRELGDGAVVRAVLEAFYPKVYADERLSPFFHGVTQGRAIDKQYSFLRLAMAGEKGYFGDRPRNAHHWMIITHELFDLRQSLMVQTLREHGLSEAQIRRWTHFEEYFRPDIVKRHGWPRIENGIEVNNEGFDREILSEASLCDHCGGEVAAGVEVVYHRRLGTISCPACAG